MRKEKEAGTMPQDAVAVDYDGEDCGAADGDASMSERKIRRLAERVKSIEASNVRLHRRIENMRADDSAINQQNEQLMKQIHRLQQQLDSKTRKDPLRSLAGPVEIFANRTGVSICLVYVSLSSHFLVSTAIASDFTARLRRLSWWRSRIWT